MVPAVEDFQQKQELIERSARTALSSFSSDDDDDVYTFKGDRLMTAEQLRQQLEVRCTTYRSTDKIHAASLPVVSLDFVFAQHGTLTGHQMMHLKRAYSLR